MCSKKMFSFLSPLKRLPVTPWAPEAITQFDDNSSHGFTRLIYKGVILAEIGKKNVGHPDYLF